VQFGKIIRLWKCSETKKYYELLSFINEVFEIKHKKFEVQFEDDDGDKITISSDDDLENLILIFQDEQKKKLLKLLVTNSDKMENAKEKKA